MIDRLEPNDFNPSPIPNDELSLGMVEKGNKVKKIKVVKPPVRITIREVVNGFVIETSSEFSHSSLIAKTKAEALEIAKGLME